MILLRLFFLNVIFFLSVSWTNRNNDLLYQRLYRHISYLASDKLNGRFPLTKGDFLAREYIVSIFKEIGLLDITHHNYQQKFDYLHKIKPHCQFIINNNIQTLTLQRGSDFIIYPESGNSYLINKKAVLIGYGNKIDTLKMKNIVNGNIVLSYLFPPKSIDKKIRKEYNWRKLIKQLEKYGAKAIIFVVPEEKYEKLKSLENRYPYSQKIKRYKIPIINISRKIYQYVLALNNLKLEQIEKRIKDNKGNYCKVLTKTNFNFFVDLRFIYHKAANLIGVLKSTSKNNDFLLIGAHYDHLLPKKVKGSQDSIRNGADDNASGVAVLLEIARSLSTIKKREFNFIFICFGAEESGMNGTKYFIKNPILNLNNLKLMINLDMVGRMTQNKLYFNNYSKIKEITEILSQLSYENRIKLNVNQLAGGTDADPFQHLNIPAIWISTGHHEDQHQVSDEINKINFQGLIKIHHLILKFINSYTEKY